MSIATKPVQRTGPAILRDCHGCDGAGAPGCRFCHGTGRIPFDVHPFGTLERAHEQASSAAIACGCFDDGVPNKPGEPCYHLRATLDAIASLFRQLVVILPEEFARTEGE